MLHVSGPHALDVLILRQAINNIRVAGSVRKRECVHICVKISSFSVFGMEVYINNCAAKIFDSHIEELAEKHQTQVLAKLPIDTELASLVDKGVIELFEADYLESAADAVEKAYPIEN